MSVRFKPAGPEELARRKAASDAAKPKPKPAPKKATSKKKED